MSPMLRNSVDSRAEIQPAAAARQRESFADLEEWMECYQRADPRAPGVLLRALSPALLRFFRFHAGSRHDAEDLLQETWLRIHRVRHSYRPGEPVLPWIYSIARRVRIDHYRRTRRSVAREVSMDGVQELAAAVEPAASDATFEALVATLPASQREVLTLLKVGELSVDEVARVTASTAGAVKQKAHRAYRSLRRLLEVNPADKRGRQ